MPARASENETKRELPKRRNPLLTGDETPDHAELIKVRRLGQTNLSRGPGQVLPKNSAQIESLGPFDYAHLRAPLPQDLKGSQIFAPQQNQAAPTSYFLMRRSTDGFISATGMFKAAFPWAKYAEEEAEKEYIKGISKVTAQDEIAGNLWVSEHFAIELADEYGIVPWIQALLDPAPIPAASDDSKSKSIEPPPQFKFTAGDKAHLQQPNGTPARGARAATPKSRGRPRAGSPEKKAGSPQKSTKKPRATKATKEADARTAREASASLQASLNDAVAANGDGASHEEVAKVSLETTVETKGDKKTETTSVQIAMPGGAPQLDPPESPESMIQKAKEIVAEAKKLDGEAGSAKLKRKAEDLDEELDGDARSESQPAKKAKLLEQQVRKEKVRNRALMGVAATLFLGAAIPFLTG